MYAKQISKFVFKIVASRDDATHVLHKNGLGKGKFVPLERKDSDLERLEDEIEVFKKCGFDIGELEMVRFSDGHKQIQPIRKAA